MAHLRAETVEGTRRVWIRGDLRASDLRRLEYACAPALEQSPSPLELDLTRVRSVDTAARAYLMRLAQRGARVRGSASGSQRE
jgi:ABC-type transporter Mla MlaB component